MDCLQLPTGGEAFLVKLFYHNNDNNNNDNNNNNNNYYYYYCANNSKSRDRFVNCVLLC